MTWPQRLLKRIKAIDGEWVAMYAVVAVAVLLFVFVFYSMYRSNGSMPDPLSRSVEHSSQVKREIREQQKLIESIQKARK